MLAIAPARFPYPTTLFVVAHFHYVLVPGRGNLASCVCVSFWAGPKVDPATVYERKTLAKNPFLAVVFVV